MKGQVLVFLGIAFLSIAFSRLETRSPTPYTLPDVGEIGDLNIPSDNPMTVEGVRLGQLLFYETLLSADGSYSCGSCHKQEFSFSDGLPRAVGYRGDTLERNTMTLVNLAWQSEFFWDGRVKSLEALIEIPVTDPREMGQDTARLVELLQDHPHYPRYFSEVFGSEKVTFKRTSQALSQFLRSIVSEGIKLPDSVLNIPPDHIEESYFVESQFLEETHRALYFRLADMCGSCHSTQVYGGTQKMFNNVNSPELPMKVPSLVNITLSGPYMHDGRLKTIEDVVEHYEKHIATLSYLNRKGNEAPKIAKLSPYDKENLPVFLKLFIDSNLMYNPAYGNPFERGRTLWPESVGSRHTLNGD